MGKYERIEKQIRLERVKMTDNYGKIVQDNLDRLYGNLPEDLAENLPGQQDGDGENNETEGEDGSTSSVVSGPGVTAAIPILAVVGAWMMLKKRRGEKKAAR